MTFEYNIQNIKYNNIALDIKRTNFESLYSMYIFSANVKGSVPYENMGNIRLYYFQIFDNNALVRDYIPVIDSSERPCLFDKVSRECYYNQGTGEFLWG